MAFGMVPSEGRFVHCGVCSGPAFERWPLANDYLTYCNRCKSLPPITGDDILDAEEIFKVITLMASFLRILGVKETYYK